MEAFSFQDGPWTLWVEKDRWFIFHNGYEFWRSAKEDTSKFRRALNKRTNTRRNNG